jgi:hypothetical protein
LKVCMKCKVLLANTAEKCPRESCQGVPIGAGLYLHPPSELRPYSEVIPLDGAVSVRAEARREAFAEAAEMLNEAWQGEPSTRPRKIENLYKELLILGGNK